MPLQIFGNLITDCKVGISVPRDSDVQIGQNSIAACETAIELRDAPSLRAALGFSSNAIAVEVLRILQVMDAAPSREAAAEAAKASGAEKILSAGANLATLIAGFFQLKDSNLVGAALALLAGQA